MEQIQILEQQQAQLQQQIAQLNQQLQRQQQQFQNIQATRFNLKPDQIIRNFSEIPAFSGEDNFKLKSFLKSIKDVEQLCGENNEELKTYCLRKTINNKIIGAARNAILEIPDQQRNWEAVETQLKAKFRPKLTIYNLLYNANEIKVYNLKDLFIKLHKIKSECNEICEYNDQDIYTYEKIDKDLIQILKSKLVPLFQTQIKNDKNLYELDVEFSQSEIYYSEDAIKPEFKLNKNQNKNNFNNSKQNNNFQKNKFHNSNNVNQNNVNPNQKFRNFNNRYQNQGPQIQQNRNFNNQNRQFNNNYKQNSGQFRQYNNNYKNNSGQYRQFNNTNNVDPPQPMEVDNIITNRQNSITDVNFSASGLTTNYP